MSDFLPITQKFKDVYLYPYYPVGDVWIAFSDGFHRCTPHVDKGLHFYDHAYNREFGYSTRDGELNPVYMYQNPING